MSQAATQPYSPMSWQYLRPRPEMLALIASIYFALLCNTSFWTAISIGAPATKGQAAIYYTCLFSLLTSLQFILLTLLVNRWTAKPALFILIIVTVAATYFMDKYGIYFDPDMVRNALNTDWRETRELLSMDMLPYFFLHASPPMAYIFIINIRTEPLRKSWWIRPGAIALAIVVASISLAPISQSLVPQIRENKGLRHLITPGNYLISLFRVATHHSHLARETRKPVAEDAKISTGSDMKPLLLVIVVGETVRADHWGLNGYARQTTPRLATMNVINFRNATACGTNTEVSVPCMFSVYGRRHYDEDRIRNSDSLLHVLNRAGIHVQWRDNQSGCKGVCDGLEAISTATLHDSTLCNSDGCLDAALLNGLVDEINSTSGNTTIVMHQMGNHGPSYHLRYPDSFRRFAPDCQTSNLGACSNSQVVNAYDNAILYTDEFLANTISLLRKFAGTHRVAMIYASDHGESLGEHGLYLHSIPYSIAPASQTHIPMVLWMANSHDFGIDEPCLRKAANRPVSHDNLFHTILGMAGIATSAYDASMDLSGECKNPLKSPSTTVSAGHR